MGEVSNLLAKVDARGVVINYTYDALNRIKTVTFPSAPEKNITYFYDETNTSGFPNAGIGRLTRIVEASGIETSWIYNDLGQIVRDIRTIGGQSFNVQYEYDLAGTMTKIIYPSGREVEYIQDSLSRTQRIRTRKTSADSWIVLADNVNYQPFGPVSAFTYGNGLAFAQSYDLHYRPDVIQTLDGTTDLQALDYGFNDNNELSEILDLVNADNSKSFDYDGNIRLIEAAGPYGIKSYDYDDVGNRVLRATAASPVSENYAETYTIADDSNRLNAVSAAGTGGQNATYVYDEVGNITNDGQYGYDYDVRGRLSRVFQGANTIARYDYNAISERVSKTIGSDTRYFLYGLTSKLIAETDIDGGISKEYIYLGDRLLSIVEVDVGQSEPVADLNVSLASERSGNVVNYDITVGNLGPDSASAVQLTNDVPANITIDNFTVTQGNCSQSGQTINCELGDLNSGSAAILSVTITAAVDVDISQTVTASVTSSTTDPNLANNTIKKAGSGCFIATAAFGSYEHQYLHVLRDFRDDYLLVNEPGAAFVRYYYANSPDLVRVINQHEWLKPLVRVLLLPIIALAVFVQASFLTQLLIIMGVMLGMAAYKQFGVGKMLKRGIIGIGVALGLLANSAAADDIYYVHTDHMNTPELVTDAERNVVWKSNRTPFGEEDPEIALVEQPFRFPGQYYDAETGLYYNLNRYYHPGLGRYITSDPIGLEGGINTYGYAGQNPIMALDPTGEWFWFLLAGAGTGVTGAEIFVWSLLGLGAVYATAHDLSNLLGDSAANDEDYCGGDEPPDCEQWRRTLNKAFHAIENMAEAAKGDPQRMGYVALQRVWFKAQVAAFEKKCGPYSEPPSLDDIYSR